MFARRPNGLGECGDVPGVHLALARNEFRIGYVIAGVWTSVCVAFPALAARGEGYR
jgi:nicotinamidase-related amidase